MAHLKKNQLNQIMAVMVDASNFAEVESALVASDVNIRLFGVAQNSSTLASTITVSKAARIVRSGIVQITLKASETDAHDHFMLRLSSLGTVSCADQYIPLELVDSDDSDIMSAITVVQSMASDAASAAQQGNSRTLVVQSMVSDVDSQLLLNASMISDTYSLLSDHHSDFQSRVPKEVASKSLLSDVHSDLRSQISGITASVSASDISDIASRVWSEKYAAHSLASSFGSLFSVIGTGAAAGSSRALLNQSRISDVYSLLSDHHSDFQSRVPKAVATNSQLSDLASDLRSYLVGISGVLSDVYSLASDLQSDFQSRVPKEAASKSLLSDVHSDLRSQISGITASVSASDISDIASRVWSEKYAAHSLASSFGSLFSVVGTNAAAGASRALLNQSRISDVYSLLSDHHSDFQSRVPKEAASKSLLSDVHSDLRSQVSGITASISASDISDIASRVWSEKWRVHSLASSFGSFFSTVGTNAQAAASRALLNQSRISDVYSLLSDHHSDFQSRVPKAVATNSQLSDIGSDLRSYMVGLSASLSDVESQLDVTHSLVSDIDSQLTATDATISNINSVVTAIQSDLPARITKNVAFANFTFFMTSTTDDLTGKTGLTITSTRSLDGGAFAATTNSATEIANGWYKIDLSAADLNGDVIALNLSGTGANTRAITIIPQPT